MKLSDEQKRFAKSIALYSLLYPVMMLVTHRIRAGGAFDWNDFLDSVLTALVLGILFFIVGTHVPKKDD
ncbi:MAG: hypothetical protein IJK29_00480 [Bacteroidales bacterium]|nr:hypothetical protein [Bacteroidales bacterium]